VQSAAAAAAAPRVDGLTLATKILPKAVVKWMKTKMVSPDLAAKLDAIFGDTCTQELFDMSVFLSYSYDIDTHAKAKLEGLGFIFLQRDGDQKPLICKHKSLPGFVIKMTPKSYPGLLSGIHELIGRVWNRDRMYQIVQEHGYRDSIQFPHKQIYCAAKPVTKRCAIMVIAEELDLKNPDRMTARHYELIEEFLTNTLGYPDPHEDNVIPRGSRLMVIDTEPRGLCEAFFHNPFNKKCYPSKKCVDTVGIGAAVGKVAVVSSAAVAMLAYGLAYALPYMQSLWS